MRNLKTTLITLIGAIMISTVSVSAMELDVSNDEEHVYVREGDDILLKMPTCWDTVYTTTDVNLRNEPHLGDCIIDVIPVGTRLTRVGEDTNKWSMVQIDGVNYFIWSEYLTTDIPAVVSEPEVANTDTTYLGTYYLTAYCNGACCCGKWAGGHTASGTVPTPNRTVANNELPFGTKLLINGIVYTVEDRGSSPYSPWIDIYFGSHGEADAFGLQVADVYIVNE